MQSSNNNVYDSGYGIYWGPGSTTDPKSPNFIGTVGNGQQAPAAPGSAAAAAVGTLGVPPLMQQSSAMYAATTDKRGIESFIPWSAMPTTQSQGQPQPGTATAPRLGTRTPTPMSRTILPAQYAPLQYAPFPGERGPGDVWTSLTGGSPLTGTTTGGISGAGGGGGANLPGAPAFGYAGAYGGVPQMPSPQATQGAALGGNLAALPQLIDLSGQLNAFNNAQAKAGYVANLPGYEGMTAQASANIGDALHGQLPPDVVNLISQNAAERGASQGISSNAPNFNAALLKSLGLTSLERQDTGNTQLSQAVARTPVGPLFDPSKFFVTPEQQQEAQYGANVLNAAPIPAQKAMAELQALLAGRRSGQSDTAPGAVAAPSGGRGLSLNLPTFPGYGGTAAGPSVIQGGFGGEGDYPGGGATLDQIYNWMGIGQDNGQDQVDPLFPVNQDQQQQYIDPMLFFNTGF